MGPVTVSERIDTFLRQAGWTKSELAERADISLSTVTRLLHGRKTRDGVEDYELGELVALKIERATVAAWTRGEVKTAPIRAIDLLAADASEPERPTGT